MNKKQGLLIVIEGIDGSGKTTQIELLKKFLYLKGLPCEIISFPRYGENPEANLVADYLKGNLGSIFEVDPFLLAKAYAGDRLLAKPLIEGWLKEGKIVIANRYVSSSKAHLGANLAEEKRKEFLDWIDELEYRSNGMSKEDLTILLVVDPTVGQQNARVQHQPDMHEKSIKHLDEANKIYLELAKQELNWYMVDCMKDGEMRKKQDIHQEVMEILSRRFFKQ